MKFENKEAENLFIEFSEKYGLKHISSVGPIKVEDLYKLEKSLVKIKSEM